jgi:hypothetical protein
MRLLGLPKDVSVIPFGPNIVFMKKPMERICRDDAASNQPVPQNVFNVASGKKTKTRNRGKAAEKTHFVRTE